LLLVEIDAAASADGILLADMTDEANQSGFMLYYRNTNQNFQYSIRNGSGFTMAPAGGNNSLAKGETKLITFHLGHRPGMPSDFVSRVNGATNTKSEASGAYSSSNPPATLFIGKFPSAVSKCRMIFKKCALFSRRLTKAEENRILESW